MNKLAVIILALCLGACTGDRFVVKVDSYGSVPTKPKTYMLYSGLNGVGVGDLQFAEFARFTDNALRARGYQRVNNPSDANYAIFLAYGIGEPQQIQETFSTPVMGQTGVLGGSTYGTINSFGNTATFSGYTSYIPTYGVTGYRQDTVTRTTYDRFVNLEAYESAEIARLGSSAPQVWKTNITSNGSSDDLREVFPVMVAAAVDKIGNSTGGKITKTIFDTDQSVKMVKGETVVSAPTFSDTSLANSQPAYSQRNNPQAQSDADATRLTSTLDSYRGWSIGKLDGVQGFTGCYAMNDNSVKLGLPLSIMVEKGRYDEAILSVKHDGNAMPKSTVGNITLGSVQLSNLPVATLTGDEAFAPLRLTPEIRKALQSRGLISWDVNENYAYVLPEAPELINRLVMCADAPNLQAYKGRVASDPSVSSVGSASQPNVDFVGRQDGLTNQQRYNLARQMLEYKETNITGATPLQVNQVTPTIADRSFVKTEPRVSATQLYPTTLVGEWVLESSNCLENYESFKVKRTRVNGANSNEWYYNITIPKQGQSADQFLGGFKVVDGKISEVQFMQLVMTESIALTESNSRIYAKQAGGRCEVTLVRN